MDIFVLASQTPDHSGSPKRKVLVVHFPDHIKHNNVVHWLCCFLKQNSKSLNINYSMWDHEECEKDVKARTDFHVRVADVVVIVESMGAHRYAFLALLYPLKYTRK